MIFYVATNGSDSIGDGSKARPWKSLSFAATKVQAGNAIHVQAGEFVETQPVKLAVGVSVAGEGSERTIFRASLADSYLIELKALSNTTGSQSIGGFTIDGANKTLLGGVLVENVNRVTLHNIHFVRCKQAGSTVVDSVSRDWGVPPKRYVTGTRIRNCKYRNCASIPFKKSDGSAAGMSGNLEIGGLDGAEISGIDIEDIAAPETEDGYGIKFATGGYFRNLKIQDCRIQVNETAKAWISNFAIELWNVGSGCEISHIRANTVISLVNTEAFDREAARSQNLKIHDCILINRRAGGSNNEAIEASLSGLEAYDNYFENASIGVAFWGAGRHLSFHNNVFSNTKPLAKVWGQFPATALWLDISNGSYEDIKVYNNVFANYANGVRFSAGSPDPTLKRVMEGITLRNNAFLGMSNAIWETNGPMEAERLKNATLEYNLRDNDAIWLRNTNAVSASRNFSHDPGFLRAGNRWDSYYRPASAYSFCIDKGTDVGLSYAGSAPDIGRFEYVPCR